MTTVTVAFPLHRSAEWVDNVIDNVGRLPADVTEILISDRTCVDEAADRLRARLADDPRVTVIAEPLGLSWEQHYQLLLEQASSELFMWMPHDDVFDATWVPMLTEALRLHPDAWLAFGRLELVERDGCTPVERARFGPFPVGRIPDDEAFRLGMRSQLGVPFRGLFRRSMVLGAGIRLEQVGPHPASDMFWVLAVALRGGLAFDDRCATRKRTYASSTSRQWIQRPGDRERSALVIVARHVPDRRRRLMLSITVLASLARRKAGQCRRWIAARW